MNQTEQYLLPKASGKGRCAAFGVFIPDDEARRATAVGERIRKSESNTGGAVLLDSRKSLAGLLRPHIDHLPSPGVLDNGESPGIAHRPMKATAEPRRKRKGSQARYEVPPARRAQIREVKEALATASTIIQELPVADNEKGAVAKMLRANGLFRNLPWPEPFNTTIYLAPSWHPRRPRCPQGLRRQPSLVPR